MLWSDFIRSLEFWISSLNAYDADVLKISPSKRNWSIGQLYMHLIESTNYFIDQAENCLTSLEHAEDESTPAAKKMFQENGFPDAVIEGPVSNDLTPQPPDKNFLFNGLENIRLRISDMEKKNIDFHVSGKTQHPGLGWFSAHEWIQFAEMHIRHHQHQKIRIDHFIQTHIQNK